jgi:hypothetical protein
MVEKMMDEQPGRSTKHVMSGRTKRCLILVGIVSICCASVGGIASYVHGFRFEGSADPEKIDAARNDMAVFNLPSGFTPVTMGRIGDLRFVGYANPKINGRLEVIEITGKSAKQQAGGKRALAEQNGRSSFVGEALLNAKRQIKQIDIKGKACTIELTQGIDPTTNQVLRRGSGIFEGKNGPTMIEVEMDESAYKQDQILKMLESIR